MAAGERPASMSADEATVYDFCAQLLTTRQVSDKNFKAMSDLVGERGIVELVALMGQYTGHHAVRGRPLSGPHGRARRSQQANVTVPPTCAAGGLAFSGYEDGTFTA